MPASVTSWGGGLLLLSLNCTQPLEAPPQRMRGDFTGCHLQELSGDTDHGGKQTRSCPALHEGRGKQCTASA